VAVEDKDKIITTWFLWAGENHPIN